MYQLKDESGRPFGTKNLLEHVRRCAGPGRSDSHLQLQLQQCFMKKPQLSQTDLQVMKQKQVEYCVAGYHSFKAVENKGLTNLMQMCVDYGAKYGKFDITESLYKRNTISRETASMAAIVKSSIIERLKAPIEDGTVSLCIDMYATQTIIARNRISTYMLRGLIETIPSSMQHLQFVISARLLILVITYVML